MKFLIHLSIFNINYEYSKMSFLSNFTCHIGHHIPSNSNNECSLGSGKERQITSMHKNRQQKIDKKNFWCFWKNGGEIFILFFSAFFGKTVENFFFFFFLPSHLHHRRSGSVFDFEK